MKSIQTGVNIECSYPVLKILKNSGGVIVMFIAPNKGIAVWSDNLKINEIGRYQEDWLENRFDVYNGSVTLSN